MLTDVQSAQRLAQRALSNYVPAGQQSITFVKYRENYVFRVDDGADSYALRVHRNGYRSDAEILEELDLLDALSASQVPVPRVVAGRDGQRLYSVADEAGDAYQVDLTHWVSGAEPLGDIVSAFTGDADVDVSDFHALGQLIAELHNRACGLARQSIRPPWNGAGLVGPNAVWGDPRRAFDTSAADQVEASIALLLKDFDRYGEGSDVYGPIHADFTPENVLLRDGQMTIIDFDDSGDGFYLFDLATAAFFYQPHPRFDEVTRALLEGYRTRRRLSDHDLAIWRPMLVARGLTYVSWAIDRPGDETSEWILQHVRPMVAEQLDSYRQARC